MTLAPLLEASPAIQLHAVAAITAFVLGAIVLFRRKGGAMHRTLGRAWVLLMLVVALSSFFIHTIGMWGPWSPIHLLSIGTIASLGYGIASIRLRNVAAHRRVMQTTYVGALCIAGFFTFLPGRIMHDVVFSGSDAAGPAALAAIAVCAATLLAWTRRTALQPRALRPGEAEKRS